jgi:oxaloacetate decarboxylase alpha subunit
MEEVPKVRKELGYASLGTPFSQMVGTQAVLNVVTGERYKVILKEVIEYLRGMYGKSPGPLDEALLKKALRGQPPITCRPADLLTPSLPSLPAEVRSALKCEEDLLTYVLFPRVARDFFKEKREIRFED